MHYDPVFHASNTWQLDHGPAYQMEAVVPTGEWIRLRVEVEGDSAFFAVGDWPPLFVGSLARRQRERLVRFWTFRHAYFSDLRVSECRGVPKTRWHPSAAPEGLIDEWFLKRFGVVRREPDSVLNLNRHFPISAGEVSLTRQFEAPADGELELGLGFSDELSPGLDVETISEGSGTFAGFADYEERGYAHADLHSVRRTVSRDVHRLTARLKVVEPFGWGMILAVNGQSVRLPPAAMGSGISHEIVRY